MGAEAEVNAIAIPPPALEAEVAARVLTEFYERLDAAAEKPGGRE